MEAFRWSIRGLWLDGESFNNGSQMIGIIYWKMNDSRSSLVLVLVGAKMEGCGWFGTLYDRLSYEIGRGAFLAFDL